ncbi:hypothetical protein PS880_05748 [Pseudomonas fluorescens]|uniref:Uncharacterized protein n=1 Tax=Pseudomonas fluorescens TaxID=294 RepID=A0A5E7Q3L7_PSEFL|nr:hypothetical protein PS880_05748 [Pseudomonas fluorescens]
MSDFGEMCQDLKAHKKQLRATYGEPCPECQRLLPRANPSILLPQQTCRIHRYKDPRPELTDQQWCNP